MKWDETRRVYVNDRGRIVPASELREYIDDYITSNQEEVDRKTEELLAGTITAIAFFAFMRELLISMHGTAGVLAYGGVDRVDWGSVRDKLKEELEYLDSFEAKVIQSQLASQTIAADAASLIRRNPDIPDGLETVVERRVLSALMAGASVESAIAGAVADSVGTQTATEVAASVVGDVVDTRMVDLIWGQVGSRSRMYLDSVYGTYENSVKAREGEAGAIGVRRVAEDDESTCEDCSAWATDEYVPMDEIQEIGSSICGSRCRCVFEFSYHGVEPLEIERVVYA